MTVTTQPNGTVLADVDRELTSRDRSDLHDTLMEAIGKHRRGLLLLGLHNFDYDAQDATDIWFDVKAAAFLKGVMRMAVVTEAAHAKDYEQFTFMAPFRTKVFPVEQRAEAIVWLEDV